MILYLVGNQSFGINHLLGGNSMKRFLALICIVCLSLSIVGCGEKKETITDVDISDNTEKAEVKQSEGTETSKVETANIVFWDANSGPNRTPYLQHIIDKFNSENEDVEVEYVGLPWKSAKEKYDVAIASGSTPDIAQVHPKWISNFVARDALLPLDDYFNAWEDKDYMIKGYLDLIKDTVPDGKLYQIPSSANTNTMWVREDVFKENGITINTWDDFYGAVETLTKDGMYGFSLRGGSGGIYQLIPYLLASTGIDYYFTDEGKVFLREESVLTALERFIAIYNTYTPESDITNGYKEMVATFDTGKAAIIQHNLGSFGEHDKTLGEGKFTTMPLPLPENGKRIVLSDGASGISIFSNTKHPDEAWRFMAALVSKYGNSYWNENIGQLPTRTDVLEEPWMTEKKHIQVMMQALSEDNIVVVRDANYLPGFSYVMDEIGQPGYQSVLLGEMTPKELLDSMADAFEQEYKEYEENK